METQIQADAVTIQLTQGYVALVSMEDYKRVAAHKWFVNMKDGVPYAVRTQRAGEHRYLHHFVMDRKPGEIYDHANGLTLDCTRPNLRICTTSQNNCNRRKSSASKSPFKGVTEAASGRWRAYIYLDKKRRWLGTFDDAADAARAYDSASICLHREFARHNGLITAAAEGVNL